MCEHWSAIPSRERSAPATSWGKLALVVVYDEEELRAFKAAQETKTYKPAVDPTPTNPDRDEAALSKRVEGTQQLHLLTGLNTVADVLKAIREEQEVDRLTVPIHHKLTLSLVEASALSGISRQRRERRPDGWHTYRTDHR